jgi:uroporphyrinogen III methyltransferase/synthase
MLDAGGVDAIAFTASSTVQHTLAAVGEDAAQRLRGLTLASIGPITTETATTHGLSVTLTAAEYTIPGLVAALETHYAQTSRS